MKSGTCIKCGSNEVYTNSGLASRGERSNMSGADDGKMSSRLFIDVVVCTNCGYFEEYVEKSDLSNEKKMNKLKSSWSKIFN
jgi:predicted nucleic-acid-binding Zn-ribbon protein